MIRKASWLDAEAIFALEQKNFSEPLSLAFIENDLKNNPLANYFVIVIDDKIIGYIGAWISDNTEILNFCVNKEYRNNGLGNDLFKSLEDIHLGAITLEVRETNLGAIRFYHRQGFRKVAMRKNYYTNGDNAILMVKE